ncbi:MAG: hypothetical protein QXG48_02775 [Thermofilaceae archaeon]
MPDLQSFEIEALAQLKAAAHEQRHSYRPLASLLSEPLDLLHCDRVDHASALTELRGPWSNVVAVYGTPNASRVYSVRAGPIPVAGATLFIFRDTEMVATIKTGDDGVATLRLPVDKPSSAVYSVSLVPVWSPIKTPLHDVFKFTVWFVTCRVKNRTDVWMRFAGRSFFGKLPRIFWREAPHTVIGLASLIVEQWFVDIVPIFGDITLTFEYGISAWCNTPEAYPPNEKCIEYRRNTWWRFTVEAYNDKTRKTVEADLNIDRHLRVTFTADDVRGEVVRPDGAET